MPMKTSTKLAKVLLTNIPIAISISLVASYIGVSSAGLPAEAFMPAFLSTTAMNTVLSYIISPSSGPRRPRPSPARCATTPPPRCTSI